MKSVSRSIVANDGVCQLISLPCLHLAAKYGPLRSNSNHAIARSLPRTDFVNWVSPATIGKRYKLANRASIYRHAHALNLFPKRQRNVRAALEKIIERTGEVDVTAPAVVAAVRAYSKINAAGQWVDRSEHVDLNALFEKMTAQEMEAYAQNGTLPAWFTGTVGATASDSQE